MNPTRPEQHKQSRYRYDRHGFLEQCCSTCQTWKSNDSSHFPPSPHGKYGLGSECRSCARQRTAEWRRTHRDMAAAQAARRYARVVAAGPELTAEEREQVLDAYGHRCAACGSTKNLELDHIQPLAQGGTHAAENRQVLCHQHNLEKGNRHIDYRLPALRRAA
jgi:5-methylcytosine-specific restriction endonuclease McrA